jgi:hypothetical protein
LAFLLAVCRTFSHMLTKCKNSLAGTHI